MSDHHNLPLLGHDLPIYKVVDPDDVPWNKAKVFKEGEYWTWQHVCPRQSIPANGYPHMTHESAMAFAWQHVRNCL
ncbi:hypothetical protein [Streptomyces halobius]|uniref:Uncharacterized protein n=1 Tax=Streptomyces halobius TaxID=2879846 RepID=A0ABY4M357_9ACTN|nr:hypothetical protein [Streptomyces halobius]UQA91618.1 hypothetical protein K9S39_06880 [Streptomyces halobius]